MTQVKAKHDRKLRAKLGLGCPPQHILVGCRVEVNLLKEGWRRGNVLSSHPAFGGTTKQKYLIDFDYLGSREVPLAKLQHQVHEMNWQKPAFGPDILEVPRPR